MNLMAGIAAALLTLGAGLLAAAAAATGTILGIPAALVLFLAAVSFFATALLFVVFAAIGAAQLAVQQGELNSERIRFADDVSVVLTKCPSSCWGDVSLPSCAE
jgi:hypothetical protein